MTLEKRLVAATAGLFVLGLAGCDTQQGTATDTTAETQAGATEEGLTPTPADSTYSGGMAGRTENPETASTAAPGTAGQQAGDQPSVSAAGQLSAESRQFITAAAQANMLEVQAGQLAAERAASEQVREFANMMVRTHSRVNDNLEKLARDNRVQLPTSLHQQHQAMLEKLRDLKGAEFDRTYSREMVRAHRQAVQLFEETAQTARDQQVQSFAQNQLPSLREHLKMAQSLPGTPRG